MVTLARLILTVIAVLTLTTTTTAWPDCSPEADGHFPYNGTVGGPFKVRQINVTFADRPMVVLLPDTAPKLAPLMVFMHGLTAEIGMYLPNLNAYASHGFAVIFPYIKSPEADKKKFPPTTNTNGEFILNGIEMAKEQNQNDTSPLYQKIDLESVVVSGHSMGATCAITAGSKLAGNGSASNIKLVVAQHPGICGPFGPPPWPSTWMPNDLSKTAREFPVLFTTATNDGAFWPKPMTAEHEYGCFDKATAALENQSNVSVSATFVEFGSSVCMNDGGRNPFDDSGHNCPFKTGVETPWVLTFMKYYAMHGGNLSTQCFQMIKELRSGFGVKKTLSRGHQ
jgi:hypothetical protein